MQVAAKLRFSGISPFKMRLVANQIRGLNAEKAVTTLQFHTKKAAQCLKKVLNSAIANAENNAGADIDELKVFSVLVDSAPSLKRWRPRARGRSNKILKRSCHITVIVSDTGADSATD